MILCEAPSDVSLATGGIVSIATGCVCAYINRAMQCICTRTKLHYTV
jgi:hypothetical protein